MNCARYREQNFCPWSANMFLIDRTGQLRTMSTVWGRAWKHAATNHTAYFPCPSPGAWPHLLTYGTQPTLLIHTTTASAWELPLSVCSARTSAEICTWYNDNILITRKSTMVLVPRCVSMMTMISLSSSGIKAIDQHEVKILRKTCRWCVHVQVPDLYTL